jgi:DNA-binding MarR family transcriptional regulator/N-acetylglutamate synthase-like GNAT family acetyltransferase
MQISSQQVGLVRAFNRDYTRRIGVLREGLLDSRFTLTELRVMYELAHRSGITAAQLADNLDLDRGYLSRLLKHFERSGWLKRRTSESDGRRQHLALTAGGRAVFKPLERRANLEVRRMLAPLDSQRVRAVLEAMQAIQTSFGEARPTGSVSFRSHRVGDMGWVIARHGELYASQYGWNQEFEALVAQIAAGFVQNLDASRERCWIAERDGRRLGCIFLVAEDQATAKLRLLLVEPEARGLGVGRELIARCVLFARESGYRRITLWTQQTLTAARRLYQQAGFLKVSEEPHRSFGAELVGESWELRL